MRRLALFQEQTSQLPDKLDEVLLHPVVTRLLARGQSKVAKRAPAETNTNENKKKKKRKKEKKRNSLDVVQQTFKQPIWTKNQS
jgi:hypothetical protein